MGVPKDQNRIHPVDPQHLTGKTRRLLRQVGATPDEIANAIRASAADPKTDAILKLARNIVVQRSEISDSDLQRAPAAGVSDGEIIETVANVALNIFMNYVSHAARLAIDFPQNESEIW